jgi:hypothetical protein
VPIGDHASLGIAAQFDDVGIDRHRLDIAEQQFERDTAPGAGIGPGEKLDGDYLAQRVDRDVLYQNARPGSRWSRSRQRGGNRRGTGRMGKFCKKFGVHDSLPLHVCAA